METMRFDRPFSTRCKIEEFASPVKLPSLPECGCLPEAEPNFELVSKS